MFVKYIYFKLRKKKKVFTMNIIKKLTKIKLLFTTALAIIAFAFFTSCDDDGTGSSRLVVRLTDSPGDFDTVNVDIVGVQVHRSPGEQETGWIDLEGINTGVVNLLDLTDGAEIVLADASIPSGMISQMRLVLGENNELVMDGQSIPLETPSAQQTGLKLLINETLEDGITYSFLLDFDAAKSVVKAGGTGNYILKPVITVVTEATSGAIEGIINPATENVAVMAIQGDDTIKSTYAPQNVAEYLLGGLPEGSYEVHFDPGENNLDYNKLILDGAEEVSVTLGEVNDIGSNELPPK